MSAQEQINRLNTAKASLKASIESKGVQVPEDTLIDGYSALVDKIKQGGGDTNPTAEPKDVNFYDYEGTLRYSYTLEEAKALESLPPGPTHPGLTFQEWNWDLEDIKALEHPMNVGANYITDDGKTRLYITIPKNATQMEPPARNEITLYLTQSVENGVTVDWGDSSQTEQSSGKNNVSFVHTYSKSGSYVITLSPDSNCDFSFGNGSSTITLFGKFTDKANYYKSLLKKVEIGSNVSSFGNYAFGYCSFIESISVPNSVRFLGYNTFYGSGNNCSVCLGKSITRISENCFRSSQIKHVFFPNNLSEILTNAFNDSYLQDILLPDNVSTIQKSAFTLCTQSLTVLIPPKISIIINNCFYNNVLITNIVIHKNVSEIGIQSFGQALSLKDVYLYPTDPPNIQADTFSNIPEDCIFHVYTESLEKYKTATNWAQYADQFVGDLV